MDREERPSKVDVAPGAPSHGDAISSDAVESEETAKASHSPVPNADQAGRGCKVELTPLQQSVLVPRGALCVCNLTTVPPYCDGSHTRSARPRARS